VTETLTPTETGTSSVTAGVTTTPGNAGSSGGGGDGGSGGSGGGGGLTLLLVLLLLLGVVVLGGGGAAFYYYNRSNRAAGAPQRAGLGAVARWQNGVRGGLWRGRQEDEEDDGYSDDEYEDEDEWEDEEDWDQAEQRHGGYFPPSGGTQQGGDWTQAGWQRGTSTGQGYSIRSQGFPANGGSNSSRPYNAGGQNDPDDEDNLPWQRRSGGQPPSPPRTRPSR
jgi:hypothetical protein